MEWVQDWLLKLVSRDGSRARWGLVSERMWSQHEQGPHVGAWTDGQHGSIGSGLAGLLSTCH